MRRTTLRSCLLGTAWLLAVSLAAQPAAADSSCEPQGFENNRYIVCSFDLRAYSLRLFWRDENGEPYAGFARLPRDPAGDCAVFAMNAGMYKNDLSPVGLYIESGRTLMRASTAGGPGNFHMKPNGVFYFDDKSAGVLTTEDFLARRPKAAFATQSGPMLVIGGRIHPRFLKDSTSRKIRNGVGVRDRHTAIFAISEAPVTFWEFARLFRDGLKIKDALYLDGSISSLHAPGLNRSDRLFRMGPIVAAYKRD